MAYDASLAMNIYLGLRPKTDYKIPQLIFEIINKCWDIDPSKWPKTEHLQRLFSNLLWNEDFVFIKEQIKEADEINEKLATSSPLSTGAFSYIKHPGAFYMSRHLDLKNLAEQKNAN
jgi:hypothetical protein